MEVGMDKSSGGGESGRVVVVGRVGVEKVRGNRE